MTEPGSVPQLRIGDRERHATLDLLSAAFADGKLTPDEFDERTTSALAARTEADLAVLTSDLSAAGAAAVPVAVDASSLPPAASSTGHVVAIMGGADRKGRWRPEPIMTAIAVMGGITLDYRDAEVAGSTLDVKATAVMGGIDIVLPPDWSIDMSGVAFMGGRNIEGDAVGRPVVHLQLKAFALMGGVVVTYKNRGE